jgi:hypothetical protein
MENIIVMMDGNVNSKEKTLKYYHSNKISESNIDKISILNINGCNCFNCCESHTWGDDNHLECRLKKFVVDEYGVCEKWKE